MYGIVYFFFLPWSDYTLGVMMDVSIRFIDVLWVWEKGGGSTIDLTVSNFCG